MEKDLAFEQFILQQKRNLQRIAYRTRGEHQLSDVISEAWVIGKELAERKGIAVDFLSASFQDLLLSQLYQHFVRYTEKTVRHAVRLDQGIGNAQESEPHPLTYALAGDPACDPLNGILEREAALSRETELSMQHSLAGAYIRLLHHFDNKMQAVADHLLISLSHTYRQCAKARILAVSQHHVSMALMDRSFFPRPWRRFRLYRTPIQLAFEFDDELPLY